MLSIAESERRCISIVAVLFQCGLVEVVQIQDGDCDTVGKQERPTPLAAAGETKNSFINVGPSDFGVRVCFSYIFWGGIWLKLCL